MALAGEKPTVATFLLGGRYGFSRGKRLAWAVTNVLVGPAGIVVMAALLNSCRLTGRRIEDLHVAMVGAGAAGVAVARLMMDFGVTSIVACENTMTAAKLTHADMLPDIGYVPAGVVEVMRKQQAGYAYIRP